MTFCAVKKCRSLMGKGKGLSFFRLQGILAAKKQRDAWSRAIKLKRNLSTDSRICSLHFVSGKPAHYLKKGDVDWYPTLRVERNVGSANAETLHFETCSSDDENELTVSCSFHSNPEIPECDTDHERTFTCSFASGCSSRTLTDHERSFTCSFASGCSPRILLSDDDDPQPLQSKRFSEIPQLENYNSSLVKQQEEIIKKQNDEIASLRKEHELQIEQLKKENALLRRLRLDEDDLINDKEKLIFFTGLPSFTTFQLILDHIVIDIQRVKAGPLNNCQKLLLTFMKLRTNHSFSDLSYRFGVSVKQASNVFKKVVVIFEHAFAPLIHWPSRKCLEMLTPQCFHERFGNKVTVIIDCFEIATERPASFLGRNQSFSTYKQKYTSKYLVGVTPNGGVSFISVGYAGKVSDQAITEDSGFMDHVQKGDVVMADRGFNIDNLVKKKEAELVIPAFKRGKKQLHPTEVEGSRSIAAVRIHVERVIGQIRGKYKIMNGPICVTILKSKHKDRNLLDIIVRACCILINLCPCIVPLE